MTEKNVIITISREAYCGGDELAKKLADKLSLKVIATPLKPNFSVNCFATEI